MEKQRSAVDGADVVVVGGGLAGLATGALAARAGRRVVVYEARSAPGGRARSSERDGFVFNEGAHALYLGGEGVGVLRSLGVEPTGGPPHAKGSMGLLEGRLHLLPAGPVALARTDLLGARSKLRVGKLLAGLGKIDTAPLAEVPLSAWLDEACPDPDAQRVVLSVIRTSTYANDPDHVSTGAVVMQLQRALGPGVLYVDGGWQSLVDGVRAAAVTAGVEIRTGAKVERVVAGPAVVVDGAEVSAGSVVVAGGGPAALAGLLGDASPSATSWAADVRPSRVAALDVGLRGAWRGTTSLVLGQDEPIYLSVHGPTAAGLAPEGCTLVSLMKYQHPDRPTEADADRRQLEALLEVTAPWWRDDVVSARFSAALVASSDVPRAAAGGLPGRPGPAVSELGGVFVAGDWVGPHGLLADASLASAVVAARAAAAVPVAA